MTNTNSHFTSKEHYLSFRAAWAKAVNSEKAKSYLVDSQAWYDSNIINRVRKPGWVQSEHHIIYNILRNRKPSLGFTNITNANKLNLSCKPINNGYYWAMWRITQIQNLIKSQLTGQNVSDFNQKQIEWLLAPFCGTVTLEMIANIKIPTVKRGEEIV